MRTNALALLLIGALALTACSSKKDKPYADSVIDGQGKSVAAGDAVAGQGGAGVDANGVGGTQEDLATNVGDRVYFGYDQYNLTPEAMQQLQLQAKWLEQYQNVSITVEGHADERGTREYNIALGERRANTVRDYLTGQGVAASRVQTISYGKERPEVTGSTPQSWAQNRRAVTKVN